MVPGKGVKWAELFPDQFWERMKHLPVVYLPMGICEPHGHVAVLGLDTIKAEYLCEEAAFRWGGIVAPTQGYQIHEVGFHAPWLADVVGNVNACMTSMPTAPMLYFFLYQLRTFHNAGFRMAIVVSGHAGGNQKDFRLAAKAFMEASDMVVFVVSDPELTGGEYPGDHAGRYEISQLMHIVPEFIDLTKADKWKVSDPETRFAQGRDASEATAANGEIILEKCLSGIRELLDRMDAGRMMEREMMHYSTVEGIWQEVKSQFGKWVTPKINEDQNPAPSDSIWKPFERYIL